MAERQEERDSQDTIIQKATQKVTLREMGGGGFEEHYSTPYLKGPVSAFKCMQNVSST